MTQSAYQAAQILQEKYPHFAPKLGIVLSSGLDKLVLELTEKLTIDYQELPGFPRLTVKGHAGKLHLGYLNQLPVVCLEGRTHTYESNSYEAVKTYIRTLKLLGCEYFIATNVSGSMREDFAPGDLVLIRDHINFQPGNPLTGPNDDDFGPRFFPLDEAYNPVLNLLIQNAANDLNITLHEGVYISVLGPNYETAAEIRAFQRLGADVVGMSTVPEVLTANHCGLKTSVIATITNYATGLTQVGHSHDAVVKKAAESAQRVCQLIKTSAENLYEFINSKEK